MQEAHTHPQVRQREAPNAPQREHGRKAAGHRIGLADFSFRCLFGKNTLTTFHQSLGSRCSSLWASSPGRQGEGAPLSVLVWRRP